MLVWVCIWRGEGVLLVNTHYSVILYICKCMCASVNVYVFPSKYITVFDDWWAQNACVCASEHTFIATLECERSLLSFFFSFFFKMVLVRVQVCILVMTGIAKVHAIMQSKNVWSGAPQTINLEPVIVLSRGDADLPWQVHFKRVESCPTQSPYG